MHRSRLRSLVATVAALATVAAVPNLAHAHFIWAFVENGQARFALLESLAEPTNPQFESYVAKLSPHWGDKALTLTGAPKNGATYAAVPTTDGVVTVENRVGVREREGEAYLLVYHAKGAVSLATAGTITKEPAEVVARRSGEELVVSVLQAGVPVPQTEVWVQWPGTDKAVGDVHTDAKGEAHFPWRVPAAGATTRFVGVRAMVPEKKEGEEGGKKYTAIRHWATLTFPQTAQTAPAAPVAVGDKPLRRILREAFGSNHEVVSEAVFNKTTFDGKLTKEQLVIHLQQRALIHEAVERILKAAKPEKGRPIPYGPAQQELIPLLRDDLKTLGATWPTEDMARPRTRLFLTELANSAKRGPYFALGVHHVYYGGTTNGGRMIGEKISETLGTKLVYYSKSDGYMDYLTEVDKITDPEARREMIQGGLAAYRYIIASSNEDIFKPATPEAPEK